MNLNPITWDEMQRALPLLTRGFPLTSRSFWLDGLKRARSILSDHSEPFGYILQDNSRDVGIMLVFQEQRIQDDGTSIPVTNISSWFVEESHRPYALMMMKHVLRNTSAVTNLTPSEAVQPMMKILGFTPWSQGLHVSHPAQNWHRKRRHAEVLAADSVKELQLREDEARLIDTHARIGCISCVVVDENGQLPFVFIRRRFKRIPYGHLVYARRRIDAWRWLGELNLFLLRRGMLLIGVDTMTGERPTFGFFASGRQPKYLRGIDWAHRVDYAYSEVVFFSS